MARKYRQGRFKPRHPEKYRGDVEHIRYMSSWELHTHQFLDNNPNILEWNSEEIPIPYLKPTDGRVHYYYPDYWIRYQNKRGEMIQEIWEVKPKKEVSRPKTVGKTREQQLKEAVTYEINKAKWKAAEAFCKKHGLRFKILTEDQLFK